MKFRRIRTLGCAVVVAIASVGITSCGDSTTAPPKTVSSTRKIYVLNHNSVTVYPIDANGNVAPIDSIVGPDTGLNSGPTSVAVNPSGNVYVSSNFSSSITVYARGGTGNVSPIDTITGTWIGCVQGIAIDTAARIYVASSCGGSIACRRSA